MFEIFKFILICVVASALIVAALVKVQGAGCASKAQMMELEYYHNWLTGCWVRSGKYWIDMGSIRFERKTP